MALPPFLFVLPPALLGVAALSVPRVLRPLAAGGTLLLALAGLAAALAALVSPQTITVSAAGFGLAWDGLSGFFLLPVLIATAGAAAACLRDAPSPLLPLFAGAMLLAVLAADGFTLLLGFELMSLASWLWLLSQATAEARRAAPLYLGMALFGGACLLPVLGLLMPPGGAGFAAIRAVPPAGWRVAAITLLVLLGAGSKAGLAPLHLWLPMAHPAAPAPASAMMSGGMTKVAVYVLLRVLFDLCGNAVPGGWGAVLLAMGAASAVLGALRALAEPDLKAALAASTVDNIGLIAMGAGAALLARGADLPLLAQLALGAALLHTLNHSVFKTLLFLAAGTVHHQAGSRDLNRLGGLIRTMPITAWCVLVGAGGLAALPPFSGFASEWMLLRALMTAPHLGGLASQIGFTLMLTMAGLAMALAGGAAVRIVGIGFLGRPRGPRAAAAQDAPRATRWAMMVLAVATLVLGVLPGIGTGLAAPALHLLAGPAASALPGSAAPAYGLPGYTLPGLLALAALLLAGLAVLRPYAGRAARRTPAWDCGFAPPPEWLPFGDPATQYGAQSIAQPVLRAVGGTVLGWRESTTTPAIADPAPARYGTRFRDPAALLHLAIHRARFIGSRLANRFYVVTTRRALAVQFATLVVLLAVIAWAEAR